MFDPTSFSLAGKTALVTGAKRGIGRGMAEALAAAGADIVGVSATMTRDGGETGDSVRGRDVTIYGLFLDVETMQPLGSKWVVRQLIMDTIGYGAKGPSERSISLTAETIWTTRNLAAFAYWSDRDQQARFPGDLGCQFIPTLKNKRLSWPTF